MSKETMEFQTEVKKVLDLMINSLYTNKEIFLRELISNSSDALDKLRFKSQTDQGLIESDSKFKIFLELDPKNNKLTISDNGIGMTKSEVISNIGTIAKSGTQKFLETISKSKDSEISPELIGQFGVGFYSCFMVASKVVLLTKTAKSKMGVRWESKGDGKFTIEEVEKAERGTSITLYLKKKENDDQDFTQEWTIRSIVKKYSDFVTYPICMNVEREEVPRDKDDKPIEGAKAEKIIREETLNSMKPIWNKRANEIKKEDYNEFYKHISHDWSEPLEHLHIHAEGTTEYNALLFLPSKAGMELMTPDYKSGIHLYVKKVFIMDNCEDFIPKYFRFVKGVIDSADLSLNISREMLQQSRLVTAINKNIVKKIFGALENMLEKDRAQYIGFWKEFGKVIKEGLHYDYANREKIQNILMYESDRSDSYITLQEYVAKMPKDQKEIYYIVGQDKEKLKKSPHLEMFKSKGYDVLFMTDHVDEWVIQGMMEHKGKKLKSVTKGDVDLSTESEKKEKEEKTKEEEKKYSSFLEFTKNRLKESVKEVKVSKRLTDSPVCLVADEHGLTANMEKILKQLNQPSMGDNKRILEVNTGHPLVSYLHDLFEKDKTSPVIPEYIDLLYNQALLTEGSQINDPTWFTKQMTNLMLKAARS